MRIFAVGWGLRIAANVLLCASCMACQRQPSPAPVGDAGGDWIVFSAVRNLTAGKFDIYALQLQGPRLHRVTDGGGRECTQPRWLPERKGIAFNVAPRLLFLRGLLVMLKLSSRMPLPELFVVDLNGENLRPLASADGGIAPHWLSSLQRLLLAPTAADPAAARVLQLIESSGYTDADWSPDGRRVVLSRRSDGEIYVGAADGSGLERLTSDGLPKNDPVWSPDGQRIAYLADGGAATSLWVVEADGSHPRRLSEVDSETRFAWSPDSREIAFVGSRRDLCVVDDDGQNRRQLFALNHGDASGEIRPSSPAWSPDSQQIAFSSFVSDEAQFQVFTIRRDGSDLRRRTTDEMALALIYDLDWRR